MRKIIKMADDMRMASGSVAMLGSICIEFSLICQQLTINTEFLAVLIFRY